MSPAEALDQGIKLYPLLSTELSPEEAASMIAARMPAGTEGWRPPARNDRWETTAQPDACRLVVVEDDVAECNALKLCLEAEGYAVWAVTTAVEGLALIAEHQPDVLITDLNMRLMDGAELALVARHYARRPLGVVMITGASAVEDLTRAKASGVDHLLHKPVSMADLVALLPKSLPHSDPTKIPTR